MKQHRKGKFRCRLWAMAAGFCFLAACAGPPTRTSQNDPYEQFGKRYEPITDCAGFVESGIASWYGKDFHGKRTSSGEVYDMHGMTAAHKILPLGTRVMVINPANGRSVIVRINDRGPFVDGRVIDLSYEAATRLGIAMGGTGRVVVVALDPSYREPPAEQDRLAPAAAGGTGAAAFSLQVGSFTNRENADELKSALAQKYAPVFIVAFQEGEQMFYRVRVGQYVTREAGERALQRLVQDGYDNVRLVAE